MSVFFLLADAPDVGGVPAFLSRRLAQGVVESLVQTQILWLLGPGLGPLDHNGIERGCQQEMVVYVGPGDADSKRAACSLDKQAVLDTGCPQGVAPIGGVRSDAFWLRLW